MKKYISLVESENFGMNIGVIEVTNDEVNPALFKECIESHFDAKMIDYKFVEEEITSLTDCIYAMPIDVIVILDVDGYHSHHTIEVSENWLYN